MSRMLQANDLYDLKLISNCIISPNGKQIVYSIQKINKKTEKKYSNIYSISTNNKKIIQLTKGEYSDVSPKFSPNGKKVAFLSNRAKGTNLFVINLTTNKIKKITNLDGPISEFNWSKNSERIVFTFKQKDLEFEKEDNRKNGRRYWKINTMFYKKDGIGFIGSEKFHLYKVNVKNSKIKQLTFNKKYSEYSPIYISNEKIAFLSNRNKDAERNLEDISILTLNLKNLKETRLKVPYSFKQNLSVSNSGKTLAYYTGAGEDKAYEKIDLCVYDLNKGKEKNLTKKIETFNSWNHIINDFTGVPEWNTSTFSKDDSKIFVQNLREGNYVLSIFDLKKNELVENILNRNGVVSSFSVDAKNEKIALFYVNMSELGNIHLFNLKNQEFKKLTNVNSKLFKEIELSSIEEVWFKNRDKQNIQGWIMYPPNFNKKKKYPAILQVHGGPHADYGNYFMLEFYFLAAQGFIVYFCNPRGSTGYTEKFAKEILHDRGNKDLNDLIDFTKIIKKRKYISKVGICGGSYGGFMVNWAAGKTNEFSAGVSMRSTSNMISKFGTQYENWLYKHHYGEKTPWENFENYWNHSPLKNAGKVKMPILFIHSEKDYNCNLEQAEQMYVALKYQKIDTELIVFKNSPHGLSRNGRTDRRIARLEFIAEWFKKYLK